MKQRRLLVFVLLGFLLAGQAVSLIHTVRHSLAPDGKTCVLCLSHSQYQFGLAYSLPAPVVPCQYAVPALEPLNDVSFPIETGYFSRAPPGLLRLSV
jgi:hypothetical protein